MAFLHISSDGPITNLTIDLADVMVGVRTGTLLSGLCLACAFPSLAHDGPGACDEESGEPACIAWSSLFQYPIAARAERLEGSVTIIVKIDRNGHAFDCRVTKSSGHEILDRATCEQYERLAHFKPALDAKGDPVIGSFTNTVTWKFPG